MTGRPLTVRDWVLFTERRLIASRVGFGHGTWDARDEAAWLVSAALRIPPQTLGAHLSERLSGRAQARARALLRSRIRTRAPLSYLVREAWFAGLSFFVDPRVIVPRSLIGEFLRAGDPPVLAPSGITRILDLCTGSGAIAIAAARLWPGARVDAADISPEALAVAARNVRRHRLGHRVRLIRSDLFAALSGERYDLILSNPPYVAEDELADLPREFQWEPRLALAAGPEGLDCVLPILTRAARHLTDTGRLVLEVGGARAALESHYPEAPLLWLASNDDECVGYWHKEDLAAFGA